MTCDNRLTYVKETNVKDYDLLSSVNERKLVGLISATVNKTNFTS